MLCALRVVQELLQLPLNPTLDAMVHPPMTDRVTCAELLKRQDFMGPIISFCMKNAVKNPTMELQLVALWGQVVLSTVLMNHVESCRRLVDPIIEPDK